jgi:hypothetical protein
MYYGNIVNTEVVHADGSGDEYGSAHNYTISFNEDNLSAGVAGGMNSANLYKGTALHEIGHPLGVEHSDGTSVMQKMITTNYTNGGTTTTFYSYPSMSKKFTQILINRRDVPRPAPVIDVNGTIKFSGAGRIWTQR